MPPPQPLSDAWLDRFQFVTDEIMADARRILGAREAQRKAVHGDEQPCSSGRMFWSEDQNRIVWSYVKKYHVERGGQKPPWSAMINDLGE